MPYPQDPGTKTLGGTSQDAADAITGHAKTVRDRILTAFMGHYPNSYTADEVSAVVGENILTTRPRVSELLRRALIEPTEERRKNMSGMFAQCWRAVVRSGGAV
jgi:hypothetical protein